MAQNTKIDVDADDWTQLTDANITEITFQNIGSAPIFVAGTNGTTPPSETTGFLYNPREGEVKRALADLFPGVSGVNRVWAIADAPNTGVFVSHA
jgi:hypothetical protein